MRKVPVAIIVSMISHAAALAWVVRDGDVLAVPLRGEPAAATSPPADPGPMPEPVAVVLLDEPSAPVVAASSPGGTADRARRGRRAISTGEASGSEVARGEPARSPWMTMRGAEKPRMGGLSGSFIDDFLARSKPLAQPPDLPGERVGNEISDVRRQLRRAERYSASEQEELRRRLVALNEQRAAEELTPAGAGTYKAKKETFTAKVDADGKVHLKDRPEKLDTQDKLMLRMGIDPYARNKLAFLDRTRDQRAAIGERHRREQLSHSAELMQQNIDRMWASAGELAARKAGLFELWDDCAEAGSAELVAGGAAARALVVGVIRARLAGADAYTAVELAELNARRRSTATFAPYE